MSKKKLFKISAACAGLFAGLGLAGSAFAGTIQKLNSAVPTYANFSAYPATNQSYKIAYEAYNPGSTNTSARIAINYAATELPAGTTAVQGPFTVTFNFVDGDARFATIGPNYVWILTNDPNLGAGAEVYAASTSGAIGPMITLTSGNVDFSSNPVTNSAELPVGRTFLIQAQWADGDGDGLVEIGELIVPADPTVTVLNKTKSCTQPSVWPLTASINGKDAGGNTVNIVFPTVSFAYVTPQFDVTGPNNNSLTAELDSNTDFYTFVLGTGTNVATITNITDASFFNIVDSSTTDPWNWIALTVGLNGGISFRLNSVANEAGVQSITFNGNPCTTSDNKVWNCNSGILTPLVGSLGLSLNVSNAASNFPTAWTLSDVNISAGYCYTPPQNAGVWYGGVEAIVPFVKSDATVGAQTYIVLYNRRNVDVPVYAHALLNDASPIITTINQIGTIPANGKVQFTADQLKTLLPELASYDMKDGVPIKFLFRVPTQATSITGNVNLVTGDLTAAPQNPFDPYISGIVVSVYGGEQRSVPLKFKVMKQGGYTE